MIQIILHILEKINIIHVLNSCQFHILFSRKYLLKTQLLIIILYIEILLHVIIRLFMWL